jgi:hypothetical protein
LEDVVRELAVDREAVLVEQAGLSIGETLDRQRREQRAEAPAGAWGRPQERMRVGRAFRFDDSSVRPDPPVAESGQRGDPQRAAQVF